MKKHSVLALALAGLTLSSCTASHGDWTKVNKVLLDDQETTIGDDKTVNADRLVALKAKYSEANPLRMALVTDSGTLNDHSFNESAFKGLNEFASKVGGGEITTAGKDQGVKNGWIQTAYYQPNADANGKITTADRVVAMKEAVSKYKAEVLVLPGYLFQSAIRQAIDDANHTFDNVHILALDCQKTDDDNNYAAYEYTDKITSVIYREEQAGYLAGYAAAMDGYKTFGFVGGIAVPAVIRYGSGYVQGIADAAKELKTEKPLSVQYYYAGKFGPTDDATAKSKSWYSNKTAEIIFACGGAVYQSVVEASKSNNNAPWIGVDVNQHADTSLGADTLSALKTSAMKNLKDSVEVLLASYLNENQTWKADVAKKVITVGAKSHMCKLPTPSEDDDPNCWGFKTFTEEKYNAVYAKIKDGTIKVNGNSDNDELSKNNFGVDPTYCLVNYVK